MTGKPLWTAKDAALATGGTASNDWSATGVSIDTRTLEPGDLFIALKGPNFDGHKFAADALKKGAAAVMVDHRPDPVTEDAPVLLVEDTLSGLQALGNASRQRTAAKIVAVTGSAGKTGTKDALFRALSAQGATTASAASYNNHWGVPLSLARMAPDDRFGVFEIGMNHAGEITPLSKMAAPHVAIVTTVEPAHIEYFGSIEAIADAKAEIFVGLDKNGTAILNVDNDQFGRLRDAAQAHNIENIISFGTDSSADARLVSASSDCSGSCVEAVICGRRICYRLGLPGNHQAMNSLAVLAAVHALGADVAAASKTLGEISALPGRGIRHILSIPGGTITLIDESYNANPASMRAAIETLGAARIQPPGRRITALGDMRELGGKSRDYHSALATQLTENNIDRVFATGAEMAAMFDALPKTMQAGFAPDAEAIAETLIGQIRPNDIVMVKGSFASGMSHVVSALREEFPEIDPAAKKPEARHAV